MRKYCDKCGKEVETKIIKQKETYDVCGEAIEVDARVQVCVDCGEEFFSEELDNATLISARNEYLRKHKFLLPEKITQKYPLIKALEAIKETCESYVSDCTKCPLCFPYGSCMVTDLNPDNWKINKEYKPCKDSKALL